MGSEKIYWIVEIGPAPNQTGNLIEFYNKKVCVGCCAFRYCVVGEPLDSARQGLI